MYFPFCFGLLLMLKLVNDVACLEMLQYTVLELKYANFCKQYIKISSCILSGVMLLLGVIL